MIEIGFMKKLVINLLEYLEFKKKNLINLFITNKNATVVNWHFQTYKQQVHFFIFKKKKPAASA